ncbi:hypothetical protein LPJ56_002751 [Coemansia sp. RSA 2599]|nr:hypothetical protein LPJ56_002751 [Coemansia sp. RSA 2599]
MFYPDSSEWRLPMGRPDAMNTENSGIVAGAKDSSGGTYSPAEPSVAGCEPPAHAAQRQISKITGYRCSHLHPMVATQATQNPCAYMGPQMVEPLALQIDQRVGTPLTAAAAAAAIGGSQAKSQMAAAIDSDADSQEDTTSPVATTTDTADLFSPLSRFHSSQRLTLPQLHTANDNNIDSDSDDEDDSKPIMASAKPSAAPQAAATSAATDSESVYHHRLNTCQYVMTYYYMAWLTQSRFEQRAATQPVGPATESSTQQGTTTAATTASVLNPTRSSPLMPLAEVTWFKMDTAAQVLTHETDKMALREAIHRLARFGNPRAPFSYSSVVLAQDATGHALADTKAQAGLAMPHESSAATGGLAHVAADHRHRHAAKASSANAVVAAAATAAAVPAATANDSAASSSDASSAAASSDDGATKAETAVAVPASRNMDIIRKTATSLGKRGGMLVKAARQGRASTSAVSQPAAAASAAGSESADANKKTTAMPRVLSIFYKFMGSSS